MRLLFQIGLLALLPVAVQAQIGVGTTSPDAKSALDIRASDKGLLIPRLTAAQRTAITSPPQGLMVYQTDGTASGGAQTGFWYYAGTGGWVYLDAASSSGLTLPYSGTASTISSVFQITNSGAGIGLRGASASGQGVVGRVNGTGAGQGVVGVKGTTVPNIEDAGVVGLSDANYAVYARSSQNSGVVGVSDGTAANLAGVVGSSTAPSGVGVSGSASGTGVLGTGTSGAGVDGTSSANANTTGGVVGRNSSGGSGVGVLGLTTTGYGVRGVASASGGYGVQGVATDSYALIGTSGSGVGAQGTSTSSFGVRGNSNSSYGVYGGSSSGSGVYGTTAASSGGGVAGVIGSSSNSSGVGVLGTTTSGSGVRGEATGSSGFGVTGTASAANGYALVGTATGAANGLYTTTNGTGRTAYFNQTGTSGTANVLEVQNSSLGRTALLNHSNASSAANALEIQNDGTGSTVLLTQTSNSNLSNVLDVQNSSQGRTLMLNQTSTTTPANVLEIQNSGLGNGAYINLDNTASTSSALELQNNNNNYTLQITSNGGASGSGSIGFQTPNSSNNSATIKAGKSNLSGNLVGSLSFYGLSVDGLLHPAMGFSGGRLNGQPVIMGSLYDRWVVNGDLLVQGNVSKFGGSFKIDHPLDPENQYLYHSFVESPDMMNVYNGNVTLDAKGEATVELPDYFEALNRDFRYQLTSLGAFMPLFIKEKVVGNTFRIAGGTPGGEVSWQVTGIRHDKWADANRIPNAVPKEPENQGKYLSPQPFGQPAARGIGYHPPEAIHPVSPTAPAKR